MSADKLYKQAIEALRFLLIAPPAGGKARGGRGLGTEAQWPMSAAASTTSVEEHTEGFCICDANGQALVYVYFKRPTEACAL